VDPTNIIESRIADALPRMPMHHASWARDHLVTPRQVELFDSPSGNTTVIVWLVTDDVGKNDANSRVVFHEESGMFGLAWMGTDRAIFLGLFGEDFAEAVNAI
jgi:hypothetical protein